MATWRHHQSNGDFQSDMDPGLLHRSLRLPHKDAGIFLMYRVLSSPASPLTIHDTYIRIVTSFVRNILNNAHVLVQNNMAANVLILPGMTWQGIYTQCVYSVDIFLA